MCQCGCGDMFPIKIIKINNNKYLVVSRYDGCHECDGTVGYVLYFFDKKGMDDYQLLKGYDVENIKFDKYGGNEGYGIVLNLFDTNNLGKVVKLNKEFPNDTMNEYESLADILDEHGLNIIQECIRIRSNDKP